MVSHIKSIGLNLCGALFALSAAHATDSKLTLEDSASKAISEFKMTGDLSPVLRTIDKFTGQPSGAVLSVCPDILNALYEAADPASLRQSFGEVEVTEVSSLLVSSGMKASYGDDFLKRLERQVP